ncbi:MAG: hypothetical protein H6505_01335 [Calditrichaeota bacterium]|nr:hypothetical protein [Calditrichota bacterium]
MHRVVLSAALLLGACLPALAGERGQAAFLKSLVIPGWGQYELGRTKHALAFFGADLLFIGSALSLQYHGKSLRDDYQAFAASHAGVRGSHNKDFYVDVGNWMNVFEFNEQRMADRSFGALYDTESEYWSWSSDADRARMEEMRVQSDRSLNRVIYAIALTGVNHLVSAFHAGRLAAQQDGVSNNRLGWNVTPQSVSDGAGVNVLVWW